MKERFQERDGVDVCQVRERLQVVVQLLERPQQRILKLMTTKQVRSGSRTDGHRRQAHLQRDLHLEPCVAGPPAEAHGRYHIVNLTLHTTDRVRKHSHGEPLGISGASSQEWRAMLRCRSGTVLWHAGDYGHATTLAHSEREPMKCKRQMEGTETATQGA